MSTQAMEPRVAERRRTVSEDRARKRLKWVLVALVIVALVFGAMWLIRSPLLSIRDVTVTGAVHSDPLTVVNELNMGEGTPTIDVNTEAIRAGVLTEPWIASARVEIVWPGSIVIDVVERSVVAPVLANGQWLMLGSDGGAVEYTDQPVDGAGPAIAIDQGELRPGDTVADQAVLGAIEFISALRTETQAITTITFSDGGLSALVDGHTIRLGRPIEMTYKATVLEALLDHGLDDGALVDLIAPTRPAVSNPQPQLEVQE